MRIPNDAGEPNEGNVVASVDAQGRVFTRRGLRGGGRNEGWQLMLERGESFNQADVTIDDENRPVLLPRGDMMYGKGSDMDQGL